MDPAVPALLSDIRKIGDKILRNAEDVEAKRALIKSADKLSIALLKEGEILDKVLWTFADFIFLKLGSDLNLFQLLVDSRQPCTSEQLTAASGADIILLERILRGLASVNAVDQLNKNTWQANKTTIALTSVKGKSGLDFFHNCLHPAWQQVPSFLSKTRYANSTNAEQTPFNDAHGPLKCFEWLGEHPKVLESFNQFMTAQRKGRDYWLDFFPFESEIVAKFDDSGEGGDGVLVVDVGGSFGHELQAIKARFPNAPGRLVLQDVSATIEVVRGMRGWKDCFEPTVHDFTTPQPIRGAKAYYLRNILHDWDGAHADAILHHIRAAMKPGYSKLLLNEFVVPAVGATPFVTHSDLNMLAVFNARERTEEQWRELLGRNGLVLERIWTVDPDAESLIVAGVGE